MRKLIWVTPTKPLGMPTNSGVTLTPPTVMVTVACGLGRFASAVRDDGVAPVARLGRTWPSPVRNSVATWPRAAVRDGFTAPSENVKMPGPTFETVNWNVLFSYGLPSVRVAVPARVSYGIWIFTWVGDT